MSWAIKPPLVSEGFEIFENKGGFNGTELYW